MQVEYYKEDPQLPIYAAPTSGIPLHELIDILMKPDIPAERVCTVQLLGVTQNAAFVVSIDSVDFGDLKADDLGSWKGTGTKRMYFRVLPSGATSHPRSPLPSVSSQPTFHSQPADHSRTCPQPTLTQPSSLVNVLRPTVQAHHSQVVQCITPAVSTVGNVLPSTTQSAPNTNPFYIRFIQGNIRICQRCRSVLKCADGSVPAPPFDLCAARAELRSFQDATGILITPGKEQPSHYHLNLSCIQAVAANFVPSSIIVPPDVLPLLGPVHKEYLCLVFGLFSA